MKRGNNLLFFSGFESEQNDRFPLIFPWYRIHNDYLNCRKLYVKIDDVCVLVRPRLFLFSIDFQLQQSKMRMNQPKKHGT